MSEYNDVKYSSLTSIYLTARGFQNNYEELKKRLIQSSGRMEYDNPMPVAATNGFFAVELYLKTIYAQIYWERNEKVKENPINQTKIPTKHNLKDLFESIDDKSKKEVVKRFPHSITEKELIEKLDEYGNGFIQWRYFYEQEVLDGDFVFLSNILESLYSLCKYYINHNHNPKEEWLKKVPQTSTIMHQEPVQSEGELRKLMSLSLKEVMNKDQ